MFTGFCKVLWTYLWKIMESNKGREVLTDREQNTIGFSRVRSKVWVLELCAKETGFLTVCVFWSFY